MPVISYIPKGGTPRTLSVSDVTLQHLSAAAGRDGATITVGSPPVEPEPEPDVAPDDEQSPEPDADADSEPEPEPKPKRGRPRKH